MVDSAPRPAPQPTPPDAPKRNYWLALAVDVHRAVELITARLDAKYVRGIALEAGSLAVVRLDKPARPGGVRARVGDACTHARHAGLQDFDPGPRDLVWGLRPKVGRPRQAAAANAAPPPPAAPETPAVPRRWVMV
jgi:hypothetical protein